MNGRRPPADHAARASAATDFTTSLVVAAGAGTGKTSLLVERILTAIGSGHAPLQAIAAITFTDKAAGELRQRLAAGIRELRALAEGSDPDGAGTPAAKAFSWLTARGGASPAAVATRAAEAERALDRATVTTIHGLCAEILRANPLAAGLPPGFSADSGLAGRRLAAKEWIPFLESELGPSGRRAELWERVLSRFDLAQLEEIAHTLGGGAISDTALAADHRAVDLRAVLGDEATRLADEISELLGNTPGLTDAPRAWLFEAERALRAFVSGGASAARSEIEGALRIPDAMPSVRTKGVAADDAAALEAIENRARPLLKGLASCDERAEADLFAALLPFVRVLRARQTRSGVIDFDGLLVRVRDLLRDQPAVRASLKHRFAMILVDEFQDTDPIQYEIVFFLAEREGDHAEDAYATRLAPGRLFIVGDAKQSIYRFRGADFAAYRRAVAHVVSQGGSELSLTANFRSIPAILRAVNALFASPGSSWTASDYLPAYEPIDAERDDNVAEAVEIWTTGAPAAAAAPARRRAEGLVLAAELRRLAESSATFRYDDVLVLFRGFTDVSPYLRALREAEVPFVISGGRAFFERTEIVQAMAVLRAVADRDDPVALLAYRRSAAGGVPDTELFAAARGSDADLPSLPAADRRLDVLRAEAAVLPVGAAVRHVLESSGLVALSGLGFEAGQRVANLEKLMLAASELSRDGHRTFIETLDALEEGFTSDEEGDSPLADTGRDAVRVMSIHKAKGLEASVVVLADTAAGRAPRRVRRFSARMARVAAGEFVRLDGPSFANGAAIAASLDDVRHEAAEDVRLLYVALTRARNRLIVFGGGHRKTPWTEALDAWAHGVTRRVLTDSASWGGGDRTAAAGAPDAAARFEAASAAVLAHAAPPFRSPSDSVELENPPRIVPGALAPALARTVGRLVHARLSGARAPDDPSVRDEVESVLRAFAGSPLFVRHASLTVLGREVPMLLEEDGTRWQGTIDLLFREPDGTLVVADFKTDATDDGAVDRHGEQLRAYSRAVRRAIPGSRVRAELWMLRSGHVLEV